jgi:hypothetical protein
MSNYDDTVKKLFEALAKAEADAAFRNSGANAVAVMRRLAPAEIRAAAETLKTASAARPNPDPWFAAGDYHRTDEERSAPQYGSLGGVAIVQIHERAFDFIDYLRVDNRWVVGFAVELAQSKPSVAIAAVYNIDAKTMRFDFDDIGTHYVHTETIRDVLNRMLASIELFKG